MGLGQKHRGGGRGASEASTSRDPMPTSDKKCITPGSDTVLVCNVYTTLYVCMVPKHTSSPSDALMDVREA